METDGLSIVCVELEVGAGRVSEQSQGRRSSIGGTETSKSCFDNIDHHGLMQRVRKRITDAKPARLVVAFLKAGVLLDDRVLVSRPLS